MSSFPLFVTCPRGVEPLLAQELATFAITELRERAGGVAGSATLEAAYRACLWSRLASRVLMPLRSFPIPDADALYAGARAQPWTGLFDTATTFAIEVAGRSPHLTHTHYAGLKVKDAIVDHFRDAGQERPNVDTERPGIRVHLHLDRDNATLSLDLAGDSLHRRGYRREGVEAPLKENLAAAILARAGWAELAAQGAPLFDPMCGSGTLLIEGAWMAADIAPGILRTRWGFERWLDHKPAVWKRLHEEALERREAGLAGTLPAIAGRDIDPRALAAARQNVQQAGLAWRIDLQAGDALESRPIGDKPGLIVTNPPYGERLGDEAELIKLYSLLGVHLKQYFGGWRAAVFTSRPELGQRMGLSADAMHTLYNGAIACKLLQFDIRAARPALSQPSASADSDGSQRGTDIESVPRNPIAPLSRLRQSGGRVADATFSPGGEDFANRLQKNARHLAKWARRGEITNYRVYDADLPDYALAVDLYATPELHAHVQEYAPPKTIEPAKAEQRLRLGLAQLHAVLEIPAARIHYKLRRSQKGDAQYTRQAETGRFHTVVEHGCKLQVNFDDYLDTGLFLDHRPMRLRIQREAAGKRFLNLFCYTGAATVHAAVGGAKQTLSIDLSNTYLEWAQRNLLLNDVHSRIYERPPAEGERLAPHAFIRSDCRQWLADEARLAGSTAAIHGETGHLSRDAGRPSVAGRSAPSAMTSSHRRSTAPHQFDLIFLDPPTFSNSKKMDGTLDIQRDHAELIGNCLRLLAPNGVLYFSTNRRGFKLDPALGELAQIDDITAQTLDEDFKRPPPAHRCWRIKHSHPGADRD